MVGDADQIIVPISLRDTVGGPGTPNSRHSLNLIAQPGAQRKELVRRICLCLRKFLNALAQSPSNVRRLRKFQIRLNYLDTFAFTCRRNYGRIPEPILAFYAAYINLAIVMYRIPFLVI